jgi:outer membrane protein assembly factor BamB
LTPIAAAENWTQFRGPTGQGAAGERGLPLGWSETENVDWKQPVLGRGWSSPVVLDGKIWMTTATEKKLPPDVMKKRLVGQIMASQLKVPARVTLWAVAHDLTTGKELKRIELFEVEDPDPVHGLNSYASPSPVAEPGRLYCYFGTFGTACVDTERGEVLWRRRIPLQHNVGPGSSPLLYKNLLVLTCDGADDQFIVALDKHTGETVWRTDRPDMLGDNGDAHKAYSTPLLIEHQGREQLVIPGAQWVVAYEPATGKPIWRASYGRGFSNVPRPVYGHGMVYICTGFTRPELWAIRSDGEGDVTDTHVAWRAKKQIPTMSSPLLVGDEIYVISDRGVATCFDALTGETHWRARVAGNYSASPVLVDGRIYFFSREGVATAVRPGKEFVELGKSEIDGRILASPAFAGNAMLLRSDTAIYRIEKR